MSEPEPITWHPVLIPTNAVILPEEREIYDELKEIGAIIEVGVRV